jgi:hypothetical protein
MTAPDRFVKRWKELTADADPQLVKSYFDWIRQNHNVYEEFKFRALQMRGTGRTRYSAWAVVNVIRWDTDLKTRGDGFKIRNDFIALLARHVVAAEPSLENFFELREMGERAA